MDCSRCETSSASALEITKTRILSHFAFTIWLRPDQAFPGFFCHPASEVCIAAAELAQLLFRDFRDKGILCLTNRHRPFLDRLNGCHLSDRIAGEPPADRRRVDDDVERAGDDEIHVVVGGVLLDDNVASLDLNQFGHVGQLRGQIFVAADELLARERFNTQAFARFPRKSLNDSCSLRAAFGKQAAAIF